MTKNPADTTIFDIAPERQSGDIYLYIANRLLIRKGASEEERKTLLASRDYQAIESKLKAENLIAAAAGGVVDGLIRIDASTDLDPKQFIPYILHGESCPNIDRVANRVFFIAPERAIFIALQSLAYLHGQWIVDNVPEFDHFLTEKRAYLFLPVTFTGFNRVKRYFDDIIEPICLAAGYYQINDDVLRYSYYEWQKRQNMFSYQLDTLTDVIVSIGNDFRLGNDPSLFKHVTQAFTDEQIARETAIQCLIEHGAY